MQGKLFYNNKSEMGTIGDYSFTFNGHMYAVGDVVMINNDKDNKHIIVKENNVSYICGMYMQSKHGNINTSQIKSIRKVKSYEKLKNGEKYDGCIDVIVMPDVYNDFCMPSDDECDKINEAYNKLKNKCKDKDNKIKIKQNEELTNSERLAYLEAIINSYLDFYKGEAKDHKDFLHNVEEYNELINKEKILL